MAAAEPAGPGTAQEALACDTSRPSASPLDPEQAVELAQRFKALADPNRLTLLSLIASEADGEACVCDLTEPVGLGQPTVSHHLKLLVDAGFLTRQKRGTWSYYSVVRSALDSLCTDLCAGAGIFGPEQASAAETALQGAQPAGERPRASGEDAVEKDEARTRC